MKKGREKGREILESQENRERTILAPADLAQLSFLEIDGYQGRVLMRERVNDTRKIGSTDSARCRGSRSVGRRAALRCAGSSPTRERLFPRFSRRCAKTCLRRRLRRGTCSLYSAAFFSTVSLPAPLISTISANIYSSKAGGHINFSMHVEINRISSHHSRSPKCAYFPWSPFVDRSIYPRPRFSVKTRRTLSTLMLLDESIKARSYLLINLHKRVLDTFLKSMMNIIYDVYEITNLFRYTRKSTYFCFRLSSFSPFGFPFKISCFP